jgi:hypothetical protein
MPIAGRRKHAWRGQTVAEPIAESSAVEIPLRPGEMSLHHARIARIGANRSNHPRIGYSARYVPTHIRRVGPRDSAMLVRGIDEYGNFDLEPPPVADYDPAAVAFHQEVNRQFMEHYTGAKTEAAMAAGAA